VTHQDDTPAEVSFKWRRVYTFALGALTAIGVGAIIAKLTDADALKWVAIALIVENVVVMGFYMAGASLVDWARLAAAWKGKADAPPADPPT
jgi:uncharacterized membrane protein YfcA